MKRKWISLIFILGSCIFFACEKEKTDRSESIIGFWELRTEYNGWGGATGYPQGNGREIHFSASGYQMFSNGQLQKSGSYALVKDSFYIRGNTVQRIIYDHQDNSVRIFVEVSRDTLSLTVDAYDGPSVSYIRLQ